MCYSDYTVTQFMTLYTIYEDKNTTYIPGHKFKMVTISIIHFGFFFNTIMRFIIGIGSLHENRGRYENRHGYV